MPPKLSNMSKEECEKKNGFIFKLFSTIALLLVSFGCFLFKENKAIAGDVVQLRTAAQSREVIVQELKQEIKDIRKSQMEVKQDTSQILNLLRKK